MFDWRNVLKGLLWSLGISGLAFLIIVVIFPNLYGTNSYYYWGNAIMFATFIPVLISFFTSWSLNRKIIRETKDRYQKITWDHPVKISYFNATRVMFWIGIWGAVIYMVLYAVGIIRLDIDGLSGIASLLK